MEIFHFISYCPVRLATFQVPDNQWLVATTLGSTSVVNTNIRSEDRGLRGRNGSGYTNELVIKSRVIAVACRT